MVSLDSKNSLTGSVVRQCLRKSAQNDQKVWNFWEKSKSLVQKSTWETDLLRVTIIFPFFFEKVCLQGTQASKNMKNHGKSGFGCLT